MLRIPGWPLRIGTWNVRTLYEAGKLSNALQKMQRLNIDILGISETRWPKAGRCTTDDYSGNDDNHHRHGVAVVISNKIHGAVTTFVPYLDQIIMLQLQAKPVNLNIIQIYAPTADKYDDEIEDFYEHLKSIIRLTKKHEINIVIGDFNAKVGQGDIVGNFGLGERNDRHDRFVLPVV